MVALSSLARPPFTKASQRKSDAHLIPLKPNGEADTCQALRFQYFPETLSDTKAVNWSPRDIPGASLPIYNWISSGERNISFTAIFTCDIDLFEPDGKDDAVTRASRLKAISQDHRNVDIRAAVAWLRQYMVPSYAEAGSLGVPAAIAPQRLQLVLPKGGLGYAGGLIPDKQTSPDDVMCQMMQCDVTYEAWFPSGLPRVATVSLAFAQTAQNPGGSVVFPSSKGMDKLVTGKNEAEVSLSYLLVIKKGR